MLVDSHSHLFLEEFAEDLPFVMERARAAGVTHIFMPNIDSTTIEPMLSVCDTYRDFCFPMIGLHPTSVNESYEKELEIVAANLETSGRFVAVGEIGIDLYWDKTFYKEQVIVFERQLNIAREMDLPIIIHSRDSLTEIFTVLKKQHYNMKGILHCFPGTVEDAHRAIDLGFLLGIGGVVTFKKSSMAEVVGKIGTEYLVLETDAPYLAPVPYRGKRNESSYIPCIAAKIAEILGVDTKKVEETTTNNAMNLFNLHINSANRS